jgi:hypothetical protein
MLAQISKQQTGSCRRRVPSSRRDEHLAAVRGRGDAGAEVDVRADVPLLTQPRPTGVDAHANRHLECVLSLLGGRDRCVRRRERHEQGVALRIHLDPGVRGDGLPQDAAVLGDCPLVALGPQLVEKLRRALDVGEQKRDGPGGRRGSHHDMIARFGAI